MIPRAEDLKMVKPHIALEMGSLANKLSLEHPTTLTLVQKGQVIWKGSQMLKRTRMKNV
jgi:hypothetical protein